MLTYDLEQRGDLPLYEHLCRCIRADILTGRIVPGERLPSRRTLAAHLQISAITVENAYAQLCAEGYLTSVEKRGYFAARVDPGPAPAPTPQPEPAAPKPQEGPGYLLDLKAGGGTAPLPFSVWARLTRQVLSEQGPDLLRPIPHNGVPELRQAIAELLYRLRGISATPEQIVVGAGTEYLYNLIVQLLGRDRIFALEDPGYLKAGQIYALNGARCIRIPADHSGIAVREVETSDAEILHISPNHQFPTGTVMPIPRRQSLLHWAGQREGRYIIEDDYDSEYRFTGRPIPPMQNIDRSGHVLYVNTFSRTLSPSLRISFLILPVSLLERYRSRLGFYACTVPALEQYTLARFLQGGYFEQHVNRSRLRYRNQRDQILSALSESRLSGRCRTFGESAGLHFLLQLDTNIPDGELSARAREQGLRLSFLSEYCSEPRPDWDHTLILPYPALEPDTFRTGMDRLSGLL